MPGYIRDITKEKWLNYLQTGDLDQTPHSAASDLDLHCLSVTRLRVSSLQWVNALWFQLQSKICLYHLCLLVYNILYRQENKLQRDSQLLAELSGMLLMPDNFLSYNRKSQTVKLLGLLLPYEDKNTSANNVDPDQTQYSVFRFYIVYHLTICLLFSCLAFLSILVSISEQW